MYTETSSNMHIRKIAINEDRTFANEKNEVQTKTKGKQTRNRHNLD